MKKPSLMKSGRCMVVVALSALLPVTAVVAEDLDPYRSYQGQGTSGAQGPVRSDIDNTMQQDSATQPQRDPYDSSLRGAEGPTRSELEAQGYTGDKMSRDMSTCPGNTSEKFAPNAYYGESNPFLSGSADAKASFLGQGRWC